MLLQLSLMIMIMRMGILIQIFIFQNCSYKLEQQLNTFLKVRWTFSVPVLD